MVKQNGKSNDPEKSPLADKAKESLEKLGNKIGDAFESLRGNENIQEISRFAVKHKRDTIVYIILLIGLVVSFFRPFIGHAIIGIVVGLYFAEELLLGSRRFNAFIENQGLFRIVIFCFLAIALFFAAPGIFLGAAVAIAVKLAITQSEKPPQ